MKKQYLLTSLVAMTFGFAACDEDYKDWADPQSNPQETAIDATSITVSTGADTQIVMDNIVGKDSVEILKFQSLSITRSDANVSDATFTPTALLINEQKLPYSYHEGTFTVAVSQLDSLTQVLFNSRAAYARDLSVKAKGVVVLDGQSLSVESTPVTVTLTPATPLAVDPNGYYIVGNFNDWTAEKMTQVSDYVYQYVYENAEGADQYYKFMLGSYQDWDWQSGHILGCTVNGDDSHSLFAVWGETGNEPGAAIANIKGKTLIQLDVENYTISVSKVEENLFMTGDQYGWGNTWNQFVPVYGTNDAFWGIYYFKAGELIKFAPQAGWGNDFGYPEATISQSSIDLAGLSNSGGNVAVGNAGWYLVYVENGASRVIEFYEPNVYLIGGTVNDDWTVNAANKFTVPTSADEAFVSPAFAKDAELRMCVSIDSYDWWKTEFVIFDGKITYRGKGGDQERVNVTAGQKTYLYFGTGTGEIK